MNISRLIDGPAAGDPDRAALIINERTTTYGEVPAERLAASAASDGVCASIRSPLPVLGA